MGLWRKRGRYGNSHHYGREGVGVRRPDAQLVELRLRLPG